MTILRGLDEDVPWIAAHAAYLEPQWWGVGNAVGSLLAATLDAGTATSKQVDSILRESAAGTHEIGTMGRHIINAFLCAKEPDGWRFVEGMLLAAQRQEGFRQSILESIDIALPDAFRHMLKVIIDNNLVRFSSTVRAADVWLSLRFDSQSARYIADTLESLSRLLNDELAREQALQSDAAEQAFLALWCVAFEDADASIAPAAKALAHANPEMRLAGLHHLSLLGLNETYPHIAAAVDDPDLRVACYATAIASQVLHGRTREVEVQPVQGESERPWFSQFLHSNKLRCPAEDAWGIFDRLVRLFERLPTKPKETAPLLWPWMKFSASRNTAADALPLALEVRSPSALLPYLDEMSPDKREWTALLLGYQKQLDAPSRDALLRLLGDASPTVRERTVMMMKRAKIQSSDLAAIEPLLSRKASDLRRGIINLILSLEDVQVAESAARLTASKTAPARLAGLELLSRMREAGRSPSKVLELAEAYRNTRTALDREELGYLDKLLEAEVKTYTLDDALGLMDPTKRTPPSLPVDRKARLVTPAAIELLRTIDALVHEHREANVKTKPLFGESQEMVFGAVTYFQNHFSPYQISASRPETRSPTAGRSAAPRSLVWRL